MVESKEGKPQPTRNKRGTAKDFPVGPPSDMGPTQGGNVVRTFGGYGERTLPKVTQSGFTEEGELTTEIQANTYKGLSILTPIEEQGQRSAQARRTPEQDSLADKQRRAIRRNNGRRKK